MAAFAGAAFVPAVMAWAAAGLAGGLLAGLAARAGAYRARGERVLDLAGASAGGGMLGLLAAGDLGFWGGAGAAFLGASALVAAVRLAAAHARRPGGPDRP